ncbi:MAG TPA: hybrid sensor histidine kinase/response regulator [Cryomorphaceae bacterium]|nr:hybrid sensor histidine kinase/response regulator [Owenweeksia sp.]MBF97914.1 hybrid sensor histidine kinase/response regulator [Owenweeksia sp.]HAD97579.1 hybrid sensor histidine kinase/response regulator [Cryomorphaceae bacterium]HBF20555.1 hybrid sensor histidine kinase/response regulator [Cryomorphaceae bacterium]HCQ15930.1 hybrid sensor histidine kinase/response regulator [Cryomorphaceae bacterium]|tara:strand:+ start:14853 stop:15953 length:1101 start_codon:yes stop_codon:yes gene_type:complete
MTSTQSKKHIKVLYLDDEDNNLRSFKAAFRREYDIYTANTSEQAYEVIKSVRPQVIFSDQRMPVTTGVDFFNAVRQIFPDPVRILITGYTDINDIIEAINKGHIYRYITKPWNEHEIRVAIDNAYDLYLTRRKLENKVEELEKINHELSRFIYSASHDLRAPLATSLGVIRVANHEVNDPLAKDYFEKIEKSVKKLDVFVHHIIDYYKNAKKEEDIHEIKFEDVLEEVIETVRSGLGTSDPQIEWEVHQENKFMGDEFRLRIILSHLISNAIKFKRNDQEEAKVDIMIKSDLEIALLEVRDAGMGILEEHIHKVFHMFFKSGDERTGSGIGLYIVKEALNKMGGSISVRSKPHEGTIFTIKIPNKL